MEMAAWWEGRGGCAQGATAASCLALTHSATSGRGSPLRREDPRDSTGARMLQMRSGFCVLRRWPFCRWTGGSGGGVGVLGFAPRGRRRAALPQGLPLPQAREAEFEAEQERLRREKEREIARLRAMQEKAQDYQAEQVLRPVSLRHPHSLSSSFASL